MNKYLACGASVAAILASGAAIAQAAKPPRPAAAARHERAMQPLTRAQAEARVQGAFARFDTNRDGFVTRDEVTAFESQRAQKMEERAQHFDASKLFARLDLNHDGRITTAEAEAVRDKHVNAKAGQAQQAHADGFRGMLARADANKDGAISSSEFDAIGQQIKARIQHAGMVRDKMATRMFGIDDANKDGRVSLAEMRQAAMAQFDRADLNHDGTITPQERQKANQLFRGKQHKS